MPRTCFCNNLDQCSRCRTYETHLAYADWAVLIKDHIAPCRCRGAQARRDESLACDGDGELPVFACSIHGECTAGPSEATLASCTTCPDYEPAPPPGAGPDLLPGVPDPLPDLPLRRRLTGWVHLRAVHKRHIAAFRDLLTRDFPPAARAEGDGVLLCGGGRYWPMACIAARMVRDVCDLPIQIWHRGQEEPVDPIDLADVSGVEIVDATRFTIRTLGGWEMKTLALLHCGWERVLYLDADAYPVADPSPLLALAAEASPFVFWEDFPDHAATVKWDAFGMSDDDGVPPAQGGQLVIHLPGFRRELVLSHWLNQHSDYFYSFGYGDQDMYRVALAATGCRFTSLGRAPWTHPAFVCPFGGRPMIVHRCQGKIWGQGADIRSSHLPGDLRAFSHLDRFLVGTGPAESVFGRIYGRGVWGHGDRSGGGSTPDAARPYLDLVNGLIHVAGWKEVVDLGCGDGHVARQLDAPQVIGVDCHLPHVERLRREVGARAWVHLDLDRDRERLPSGDVALLKDVLHHWPSDLILDWLQWARSCGKWRRLVLTNDRAQQPPGVDCCLGGYRALRLDLEPLRSIGGLRPLCDYLHKSVYMLECAAP